MIYVLWFDRPLGSDNPRGRAQFYVGYADDDRLAARFAEHQAGRGAAITRAAVQRGVTLHMLAFFEGSRADERKVKQRKNTRAWLRANLDRAIWRNDAAAPIVELSAAAKKRPAKATYERIVT